MSYILEALKKAQAERQLGSAPTIHAPQPVQASASTGGAAASRKPLLVGLGAGAVVVLAGAALLWHRAPAPAPQSATLAAAQPSTPAAEPVIAAQSAPPSATAGAASATLAVRAPDVQPAPPAPVRPAPARVTPAAPAALARADTRVAANPAAQPAPAAPSSPAPEDSLPLQQQLPETIQAQIPRVAFGGYMYSSNPSDRLLLVDKGLRHEGEEVAPGLVLEKLLPRAAVMNFRGVRYRVGL